MKPTDIRKGTKEELQLSNEQLAHSNEALLWSSNDLLDLDQLKEEREKLRLLVELSFEPIIVWDFDKGIVEWNQGCEQLYGFTRAEAAGRSIHDLLRTSQSIPVEEFKTRLKAQGECKGELRRRAKDGHEVIVESRQQTARIAGRLVVLETNRDITERQRAFERLTESEARFRVMADSAPVPIWVSGVGGEGEFANKASLDMFGNSEGEAQGFDWRSYLHPDDRDHFVQSWFRAFDARAPFRSQGRFRNAQGEYRWYDSVGMPRFSESGKFLGYVGARLDVTEARRIECHTQFINELDLELSRLSAVDEIVQLVTGQLAKYLAVDRCYVSEIEPSGKLAIVRRDWESLLGTPSAAGEYRIGSFNSELVEALETGQAVILNDVMADPRTRDLASKFDSFRVRALLSIPAMKETQWEATLTAAHSQRRDWRPDEVQLMRDIAPRLWLAVTRARAVQSLRESEERARRTLAEQMVAGVAETDLTGKFTMVNQRYCEIVGRTKAELVDMRIGDITHPDDWAYNAKLYSRLFENGESFFIEKRYRRKDGSEIWVNTHVSPIRNAQGKMEGAVSVVIDITARKLAEQELAEAKDRLAADLEAMTRLQKISATFVRELDLPAVLGEIVETAIAITSADKGNMQLFDSKSGKLTIVAQRGFEQPFLDFWNAVAEGKGACGTALQRGERVIVEDIFRSPIFAGTPDLEIQLQAGVRAVQFTPVIGRTGRLLAVFSTHYVTPRRPGDRSLSLLDLLARLAADVIERAQYEDDLRSAYAQADAATRAKDEFLAVVSHELRSPLTAILLYVGLLRTGTQDEAQIKHIADIVERNGKMQLRLIEDLLDTARIISGKLKLEVQPLNLVGVITTALDVVRPAAQAKDIELRSDLDSLAGQITGDPQRLQQVIWNLLSNSIKFTPRGGFVEISLQRVDPYVQVIVRDTGKGIEPEFLPHIFERFRQSDMSSGRRVGGLGLGLSLVKHLVELHGGTIEGESPGKGLGTTFTVRLPLRAVYTAQPNERETTEVRGFSASDLLCGVRVLIVDDMEDVRTLLTLTLKNYGADVQAVASGKEAVELLARQTQEHFDVLICDIALPDEDGYAVIRKIRAGPADKGGSIPAIALTAYGSAADRVRALEAGFEMHVAKPVEPDELAAVIQSLVKRSRSNPSEDKLQSKLNLP